MAKKKAEITGKPQKEVVWSDKYQCWLTKENAIFDEVQKSWINEKIEENYKKR